MGQYSYIYLQPKHSSSSLQLPRKPAVPVPPTPPLGIAGHTGAGTQRNVMVPEPGVRLFDMSHFPERHWALPRQHPPTGLEPPSTSRVKQEQRLLLSEQNVLPGHPKPPATVYIDIKEEHDRYNVS